MMIKAFPYEALPIIDRTTLDAEIHLRQAATRWLDLSTFVSVLSDLTTTTTTVVVEDTRVFQLAQIPHDAVGVVLSPAHAPGMSRGVLIDVDPALAHAMVTRTLKQRSPRVVDSSRLPASAASSVAGAFAAILHAALRRAHKSIALRVVAAGPAQALARDLHGTHHRIVTAWLTVLFGDDAYAARVSLPTSEISAREVAAFSKERLTELGEMPLSLPLVVATCLATRSEISTLEVGDAFLVPGLNVSESTGRVFGKVVLIPPREERGIEAVLEEADAVLRTGGLLNVPWDRMTTSAASEETSAPTNPTLEVLEDAPVVVRVELGAVEMKAREWAALSPGDVLSLGRKIGEPAILRASGVEIARGELVQIDGEYGVRILKGNQR
jgi:flagellar motor switch protein FliN